MPERAYLSWAETRAAILDCAVLAIACLASYLLVTRLLSQLYFISTADARLGGIWAVIATIFGIRDSYRRSVSAAVSRIAATLVSFLLCLLYLLRFADTIVGVAIGVGAAWIGLRVIRPRTKQAS